jgi:hypothetical protein
VEFDKNHWLTVTSNSSPQAGKGKEKADIKREGEKRQFLSAGIRFVWH